MAAPRKDNIKEKILAATRVIIDSKPFSDISLADIAEKAGISKGTLYYHYKSKGDIFYDLTDMYLKEQWDDFLTWTDNKDKDTSIQRLVKYVIERNTVFSKLRVHLLYEAQLGDEELRKKLANRYEEFRRIISEKIAERTDIPSDLLTWLILLASDGIIVQQSIGNESFDTEKFLDQGSEFLKNFNK